MEVDTGAAVSLMAENTQRKQFPEAVLEPPQVWLSTYSAEALQVVGAMKVQVHYDSYVGQHLLYVVSGDGPTLLRQDWLQYIHLNWQSLGVACIQEKPPTLQAILHEYDDVFSEELGTMKEFKARPRFHRPRSVPYALKGAIEKELDHLEETGVIEKVAHAKWAVPIVVVPKRDGTVRLCDDYKVTVNRSWTLTSIHFHALKT